MTQEEKELLLQDLCSRLVYGREVDEVLSIDKDNEELTIWKSFYTRFIQIIVKKLASVKIISYLCIVKKK